MKGRPRVERSARGFARLGLAVLAVRGLAACEESAPAAPGHVDPIIESVEIALQDGPTIAFDLGVEAVYCAATVRCEPELLVDPFTGRRATTLVLASTCNVAEGFAAPAGRDVFQAIQRRMACYDAGDPADPSTWLPAEGHPVIPLREEIYAGLIDAWGDTQYNLAVLPLDALGHAFCRFEAWGVFDSVPLSDGARGVSHVDGAPVTYWEVFIESAGIDDFDCHLDRGDLSRLRFGTAVSVTHTLPTPVDPGRYPRTQSFAIVAGSLLHMEVDGAPASVHALRVAYGIDADFPAAQFAQAGDLATRDLWVADPETGLPLDVAAGATCALTDASGELDAIAVELVDWWTRSPLGALIVHAALGQEPFECERLEGSSPCRLLPPQDAAIAAPCLKGLR